MTAVASDVDRRPAAVRRPHPLRELLLLAAVFTVYGAPQDDTMANQYAAMPSLHAGWAMMIAIGLIAATRTRWRWLWLAHPALATFVVVGTANHYWLDVRVAGALLAAVLVYGWHAAWHPAWSEPGDGVPPQPPIPPQCHRAGTVTGACTDPDPDR